MNIFLTVFVVTATLSASIVSAQPNHWRFKLSATTYRGEEPNLAGRVDIVNGFAGFNRTKNPTYPGFVNFMDTKPGATLPQGPLFKENGKLPGYLKPTGHRGLYDFAYGPIPKGPVGILSKDFAITELACGGNCGGLQLVYAPASTTRKWVAYQDKNVKGGWKIRYWNGNGQPPAGGRNVWLWRESV